MPHELPNVKAIPGMEELLKSLPDGISILGIEPELTFEWKLAIYDAKIANNIESGNIEAVGRLIEMREAIIEERFILTDDYLTDKAGIIAELEPQEKAAISRDDMIAANRLRFEKYRRLFRREEQFLAINYPFKTHAKDRIARWTE